MASDQPVQHRAAETAKNQPPDKLSSDAQADAFGSKGAQALSIGHEQRQLNSKLIQSGFAAPEAFSAFLAQVEQEKPRPCGDNVPPSVEAISTSYDDKGTKNTSITDKQVRKIFKKHEHQNGNWESVSYGEGQEKVERKYTANTGETSIEKINGRGNSSAEVRNKNGTLDSTSSNKNGVTDFVKFDESQRVHARVHGDSKRILFELRNYDGSVSKSDFRTDTGDTTTVIRDADGKVVSSMSRDQLAKDISGELQAAARAGRFSRCNPRNPRW